MTLRERKKAQTRALIQRAALRLFREHGYAATTVEQIAEAAEVSPSTLFRYFPSKEDLVLVDQLPAFTAALRAAPPELGPVAAVRQAIRSVTAEQDPDHLAESVERELLMITVPELWSASLRNITSASTSLRTLLAERLSRDPVDLRAVTGAIMGVISAVWFDWADDPTLDGAAEVDRALADLEVLDERFTK
ncbi:TetR/AcrR family transcriptional regulator [Nonomuraea sp. NPDC050328]|uniref:TetR/AcrR family transcriptional regulator n=1 Tax=Nonomuraea sp. NPDC050328 TaxID=3364361 RepID=UPI0037973DE8